MTRGRKPRPAIERFRERFVKVDGCWEWTGAKQAYGYGRFGLGGRGGKVVLAHRFAYEQYVGPIPDGMTIDHLCRNTSCVNPGHMEPVTREVNARRGNPHAGKTHCDKGHELTPENVYVSPSRPTVRDCRECRRARRRARYERSKRAA